MDRGVKDHGGHMGANKKLFVTYRFFVRK
jgi:hypothetical protein